MSTVIIHQGSQPVLDMQLTEDDESTPITIADADQIFALVKQGGTTVEQFSLTELEGYTPDCIEVVDAAQGMLRLTLFGSNTAALKPRNVEIELKIMNGSEVLYTSAGLLGKVERFNLKDAV
jgi:hypothetical protein